MRHTRYGAVQLPKIKQFCKHMQMRARWSEKKKEKNNGKQCGGFKPNLQYILSHWYEKWFSSIKTKQRRERVCKKCWTLCSLCNIMLFKQCILAFSSTNSSNDTFHISPYTQNELMPMVHRLLFFVHYSNSVCRVLVRFRFILLTLYIHGLNRQKCCHRKMNYRNIVSTFYYQHKLNSEFDSSAHFKCFIN